MNKTKIIAIMMILSGLFILAGCIYTNTQPAGLTPVPSLAPPGNVTLQPYNPAATSAAPGAQGTAVAPGGGGVVPVGQGGAGAGIPAVGAALFMQRCSPCHGNQGQGDIGPGLRNDAFITSGDQAVYDTIAHGRLNNGMPAWLYDDGGPLNSIQINDLVAYLKTLQNVPQLPKNTPLPPEPTEAPPGPNEPTAEPARPSNEGAPGAAIGLQGNAQTGTGLFGANCAVCHGPEGLQGIPNPGSDDGTVPPLNPIDPTMKSQDEKTFMQNIDLFIEHGSVPAGPGPQIVMPSFGDSKLLTDQQIADIIAYVIAINSGQ